MEDNQQNITDVEAGAEPRTPNDDASDVIANPKGEAIPPMNEMDALRKECADNLTGWQRALADYANLKRESEKGATEIGKYASAGVVTALLPILDSFAKAHAARPANDDAAKLAQWADGIGHIKAQLDGAMAKLGLSTINESGLAFDPAQHEAMMMEPATEAAPSGTVVKVLDPGYKMHDRVLRPAKVVVAE